MLTGSRLFHGETVSHTLADVLRGPIDFDKLPKETPSRIREFEAMPGSGRQNAAARYRRGVVIGRALADPERGTEAPLQAEARATWAWAVAGVSILALAGVLLYRATRPAALHPLIRLNAEIAPDMPLARAGGGNMLALSPDGTRLAVPRRGREGPSLYAFADSGPGCGAGGYGQRLLPLLFSGGRLDRIFRRWQAQEDFRGRRRRSHAVRRAERPGRKLGRRRQHHRGSGR